MKDKTLVDSAVCIATEVIGANCTPPAEGVTQVAGHIVVRRDSNVVIIADSYLFALQTLEIFGADSFAIAAYGDKGTHLGRAYVRILLASKPGTPARLIEYQIPTRIGFRYTGNRMTRANIDTKNAVKLPQTYGSKGKAKQENAQ